MVSKGAGAVAVGVDTYNQALTGDTAMTISSAATDAHHIPCAVGTRTKYVVRRLTPTECELLQGFPKNWTNIGDWVDSKGKKHKGDADAPRYKALGNSISLPNWDFVIKRISATSDRPMTMASLFDGIGGFPLLWERHNGKGSCLWASEIEEFPIAVTKLHFPEED